MRLIFVLSLVVSFISGCSSTDSFDIYVRADNSLVNNYGLMPSFEVDLVGVNEEQKQRIMNYSVDEYFSYNNVFRQSLSRITYKFSQDHKKEYILSDSDPIWEEWDKNKVTYLVLITNIPFSLGKNESRHYAMPFATEHWYQLQSGSHYFSISPTGISKVNKAKILEKE